MSQWFGGGAPNKLEAVLKVGFRAKQVTHAIGMAESLSLITIEQLDTELDAITI